MRTRHTSARPVEFQPFTTEPSCSKCLNRQVRRTFGTICDYLYGGNGRLMSVATSASDPDEPHLVVECTACGFSWLMRPADYEAS